MPYRPKYKKSDGTLLDLPIEAETAVKLKSSRSIGLSGVTATSQSFNGTSAITIPVTAVPGSLLTGSTTIPTSGNAGSATKLETARTIGMSGVTATAQSFNGTSNITIPVTAVPGTLLTGSTTIPTSGNAGSATKLETARTIGMSGVTATAQSFNGTSNITIPVTAVPGSLLTGSTTISTSGNAGSATKLQTARTIGLSGVTATAKSFDGTGNITIPITGVPASLLTGTIVANKCDGVVKEADGTTYTGLAVNSSGVIKNGNKTVRTMEPFYVATIGTYYDNYTILSGDTFPTPGQMYRVVFEDNSAKIFFDFVFPAKTQYTTTELTFSLMFNVAKSYYDQRITATVPTYKYISWSINHTDKIVKETRMSAGSCAATTTYFKGIYKLNEEAGAV